MSYTEQQIWDLLGQAHEMPYGAAQIALVEQVIAHADALRMAEAAFDARMLGTTAYTYGGEPAKAFVTFSWCLAEFDREPGRYPRWEHTLKWHFKYMVAGLTRFPEVPLDRTYAVLDDMERRWRDGGHSLHAVYSHRHLLARHLGDLAAAQEWYDRWVRAPRDSLSDCVGCDPSAKASWLSHTDRDEEAVALAEPVLAGRLTCNEQPQNILTTLLLPYLRTGRRDQARDAHRRAYRLHRPHLADLSDIADHIRFCALTGNEARGLDLLERHLDWLDRAPSPYSAMWFCVTAGLLLRRVSESGHGDAVVHRRGHGDRPDADVPVDALRAELTERALALAARFDARNGTGYQSERMREILAEEPIVDHLPLGAAGSRAVTEAAPEQDVMAGTAPPATATPETEAATPRTEAGAMRTARTDLPDGPDELLDFVEAAFLDDRDAEAYAAWTAFDERYGPAELTVPQRARRVDGAGSQAANERNDVAAAEEHWRTADELYAQCGDEVRRQVVRGRLGYVLCEMGRTEEGHPLVEASTGYLVEHGPRRMWSRAHLRFGIVLMAQERPEEALTHVDSAAAHAGDSGERDLPAQVATVRAQVLGQLGRVKEAADAAGEARWRCRELDLTAPLAAACWLHGIWLQELGEADAAVEAFDEALRHATDPELRRQVVVQRAAILAGSPRAAEAIDDLVEAVASLTADRETAAAARVQQRLAVAYFNSGRTLDAAEVAEEALAAFEAGADDTAYAVRDLLAAVYQRLGQPDEAIEQLEAIAAEQDRRGHPDLGQSHERIGELLDELDRDGQAAARFARAAQAYSTAERPLDEVRAGRRVSTSLLWSGDPDGALAALRDVDRLAETLGSDEPAAVWERAMIDYDGARITMRAGEPDEAVARAAAAAERFRGMGAALQAAHSEAMHGELLLGAGRPAEAAAVLRAALAELPEDGGGRERMADKLADALSDLGRVDEAEAVRREHGLT